MIEQATALFPLILPHPIRAAVDYSPQKAANVIIVPFRDDFPSPTFGQVLALLLLLSFNAEVVPSFSRRPEGYLGEAVWRTRSAIFLPPYGLVLATLGLSAEHPFLLDCAFEDIGIGQACPRTPFRRDTALF